MSKNVISVLKKEVKEKGDLNTQLAQTQQQLEKEKEDLKNQLVTLQKQLSEVNGI